MAAGFSISFQINSLRPREKMKYMARDTRDHIRKAFDIQKIYPYGEVYPGWFAENRKRAERQSGAWYSTGAGANTFYYQLRVGPSKIDDWPSEISIEYFFNEYLSYVDYGVGKNRPLSKVQHGKDARRKERYTLWEPKTGKTHRPLFRKELRHLARRGALWMTTWSGRLYFGYVFKGLEGITTVVDKNNVHGGLTFDNLRVE